MHFLNTLPFIKNKTLLSFTVLFLCVFSFGTKASTVPDFSIETIDNQIIEFKQGANNKPVYLVFWATWCPSCLREVPKLKAIHQQYKNDIDFVAINVDRTHFWYKLTTEESKNPVRDYLKEQGITYPVALDDDNVLSELFDVKGTPTQVLINSEGKLVAKFHSVPDNIQTTIQQLL